MKSFDYFVKTCEGIHARPATLIVSKAKEYKSEITITNKEKTVDAKRMIAVMSLNAKQGDSLKIIIKGEDEDVAYAELLILFKENI